MALFKISKGLAKNLMANVPYAKEGFAYFTTDDGKLYIDIAGDGTSIQAKKGTNRICLNSDYADRLKINSNATKAKDNQVARFNGNDGSIQGSDVIIDDEGTLVATKIYATNTRINETTGKIEIADIDTEKYDFGVVGASYFQGNVDINGKTNMIDNLTFQKINSDNTTSTTATIGAATGYITGTWLQTTSVGNKVGDFATIDSSGWIHKRTAAQARQDMGLSTAMHFIGKATVDITDGSTVDPKIIGYTTKTAGDVIIDKNNSYEYVWTLEGKWERLGPDGSYSVVGHNHDDVYIKKVNFLGDGTDLNNTLDSGFYRLQTGTNFPSEANYGQLINSNGYRDGTNDTILQICGSFPNKDFYIRGAGLPITTTWHRITLDDDLNGVYVKKSGDTMTGMLKVTNAPIFSYIFESNRNFPAYVFDKPGSHLTGIGSHGNSDEIYFGAVNTSDYNWINDYYQKWTFNGRVNAINGFTSDDSCYLTVSNLNEINFKTSYTGNSYIWLNFRTPSGGQTKDTLMFGNGKADNGLGTIKAATVWGAVWNDYAEFREGDTIEPGKCVIEVGNDTLITSTERMMPGANITSDTFGFAIGETEQAKTPIAVSGRVLAYPYESREEFKKNIGRPVCSGPNGTVSIMTDEEYRDKGYCAIGTISAVPDYEEWGTGKVKVNGRVWIKVF